jgi:hypothetical protein
VTAETDYGREEEEVMEDQARRAAYAALYSDIRDLVGTAPAPAGAPYVSGERASLSLDPPMLSGASTAI